MDGLDYYEDINTNCQNFSAKQFQDARTSSIISIVLLVPSLILQLFFIYRYKSTFLHRQFLYTTVIVILFDIIYMVYTSTIDVGCLFFYLFITLVRYIVYVEIMQITTIHLLLLYKLCKHIETRTTQRLQALCCNIRPRLRHDVMIVFIQLGLPLPLLIADIVVTLKTNSIYFIYIQVKYLEIPLLAFNALLGLTCTVLLVLWCCILWKRRLLKNKVKFVCTQVGHILLVLVVLLIGNILLLQPSKYSDYSLAVASVMQIFLPLSFGVYILISIPSLQRKVTTKAFATNRHTNPPSTRVSLPTDTAEHAPNFLSPSTSGPSEVTPLRNN